MKKTFTKKIISNSDLVNIINLKTISVSNVEKTLSFLDANHYYRIRGYWDKNSLNNNVTFEDVLSLYNIDAEMRAIIFELVSKFEILLKGIIVSLPTVLPSTHKYYNDPHFYNDSSLFDTTIVNRWKKKLYNKIIDDINNLMQHSKPVEFINHYKSNYQTPSLPPIWMLVEVWSFGDLRTLIKIVSDLDLTSYLSNVFKLTKDEYNSLLYSTNILRNICAHHGRLISTEIVERYNIPLHLNLSSKTFKLWSSINFIFHVLKHNNQIDFILHIIEKIEKVQKTYNVDLKHYGFPTNWLNKLLWFII